MPTRMLTTLGIPAAGKSTWADETGLPVVSLDRLRSGGHGITVLRRAVEHVDALLAGGEDVIVDACNLLPEQRRRWLDIAARYAAEPHLVVFDVPLDLALARNAARRHPVPAARVSQMQTEFETALLAVEAEPWATVCDVDDISDAGPDPRPDW